MDPENLSCEEKEKNPNLDIAQLKFMISLPEYCEEESKKRELYKYIKKDDMAPYYEILCNDLNWKVNIKTLKAMKDRNTKALEDYDKEIEYALDSLSTMEVKEAYLNKANYLSKIGDKDNTIKTLSQAFEKTVSLGYKLDNIFHCVRIGLFFKDIDMIKNNLQRAKTLMDQGADWHSRNCYRMLKSLYCLAVKDFPTATELLLNATSTFVCTELVTYLDFIKYTLISAMLTLNRREVKKFLIDDADVQQALHSDQTLREYLFSLYDCDYKLFFLRLADIEILMKCDMFLNPHYKFYVREMKIKAYDQLLSTYRSLKISFMADQFGVSNDYIENEVSKLIAAGRLDYKIDKSNETIVNTPKKKTDEVFHSIIKHGDLLLNRIHKLSRVINI